MKKPPLTTEGTDHRANGKNIVPRGESCPNHETCIIAHDPTAVKGLTFSRESWDNLLAAHGYALQRLPAMNRKTPHGSDEGAGHRTNGKNTLPHGTTCPNSQNCRHWHYTPGTETAECAYCWQTFDRETMAAIFAGCA